MPSVKSLFLHDLGIGKPQYLNYIKGTSKNANFLLFFTSPAKSITIVNKNYRITPVRVVWRPRGPPAQGLIGAARATTGASSAARQSSRNRVVRKVVQRQLASSCAATVARRCSPCRTAPRTTSWNASSRASSASVASTIGTASGAPIGRQSAPPASKRAQREWSAHRPLAASSSPRNASPHCGCCSHGTAAS